MVCFPESSFGTTGVLTLTFLLVLKLDFFMDIGLVTFTSIESFNLAYFPQDVCLLRKVCGGLGFRCSLPNVAKSTLALHWFCFITNFWLDRRAYFVEDFNLESRPHDSFDLGFLTFWKRILHKCLLRINIKGSSSSELFVYVEFFTQLIAASVASVGILTCSLLIEGINVCGFISCQAHF